MNDVTQLMANNPVVMYPDYCGKSTREGFPDQIKVHLPNAAIIPVFNGAAAADLDSLIIESHTLGLDGVKSEQPGLAPALMTGYHHCLDRYPGAIVVRLDTSEHDVRYAASLAGKAAENEGLVIGDLSFSEGMLIGGSVDEFIHRDLFPKLYHVFAGLSVSCAHGYQALAPSVLLSVYEGAGRIVDAVATEQGVTPTWGFDGAMLLSAVKQKVPVEIVSIPAQTVRHRPISQIVEQFERALMMCRAAENIFKE